MAEKIIQNPSITPNDFGYDGGAISSILGAPLVGAGGGTIIESDFVWLPSVTNEGVISWQRSTSATAPSTANIMGPQGNTGANGADGTDGISPTFTITPIAGGTHITISGAQGEDGFDVLSGAKGTDGAAGFSPTIALTPVNSDASHDNGGTQVEITYKNGESTATTAYTAWNGNDGESASVNLFGNNGVSVTQDGTSYTVGLSGGVYVTSLSAGYADYANYASSAYLGNDTYLGFDKFVTKPTSLVDKYLVLRTDSNGAVSGWSDLKDQSYSKTEALGTFVATANIDTTTLSGNGKAISTKLGVKTDVIATRNYVNSSFLPTSGGTVSGSTYFSVANGKTMIAVASAATLIGASRQTSANFGQNVTALGTTWIGVGGPGMQRGFLKYTQDGNVGDLESNNTMQVEFTPNNKGTIFAKAKNNGTYYPDTQILNPTKNSCDAMVQSANANLVSGPNYMLAKNADGQFVIGAACINCTAISDVTLSANTYYFVYEV